MNFINRLCSDIVSDLHFILRTPEYERLEQRIDEVARIREALNIWNSDKEIRRIWNQDEPLFQQNSLCYLGSTLTSLYLRQTVDKECGMPEDDFVYQARKMAIDKYEREIIPRYEAVFGKFRITRYGLKQEDRAA